MAKYTVRRYMVDYAQVRKSSPNSSFKVNQAYRNLGRGSDGWNLEVKDEAFLFILYDSNFDNALLKKKVTGVTQTAYFTAAATENGAAPFSPWMTIGIGGVTSEWNPNTITYNTPVGLWSEEVFQTSYGYSGWYTSSIDPRFLPLSHLPQTQPGTGIRYNVNGPQYNPAVQPTSLTATISIDVSGARTPYLEILFDDMVPSLKSLYPTTGLINHRNDNTFNWSIYFGEWAFVMPVQSEYTFEWRISNDSVIHTETVNTETGAHVVPADTFPEGRPIQWRVKVVTDDDIESAWHGWYELLPENPLPKVLNPAPQTGYIDPGKSNVFSWVVGAEGFPDARLGQRAYEMEIRDDNSGAVNKVTGGNNTSPSIASSYIPANTYVSWRVRVQSDYGLWSDWTAWYTLTTVSSAAGAVAIAPRGEAIMNNTPIQFAWVHASPTGRMQAGWEIQGRSAGEWYPLAAGEGRATQYTLPNNTLAGGAFFWRVRTRDESDTWGDWSDELENYIVAAPDTPAVNEVPNETMPIIGWQSAEQTAYHLIVRGAEGNVVYDTKARAGANREHRVETFLSSGSYTFEVRVQNTYGLWSLWGIRSAQIALAAMVVPAIAFTPFSGGVRINLSDTQYGAKYLLYRDEGAGYEPIARLTAEDEYQNDYTCAGACRYFWRAVSDTTFADSEIVEAAPILGRLTISSTADLSQMVQLWLNRERPPIYNRNTRLEATFQYLEGRTLPVAEFAPRMEREHAYSYSSVRTLTPNATASLERMIEERRPLLVRDGKGRKYFGVALTLPVAIERYSDDMVLTLIEVSNTEAIPVVELIS